MNPILQSAPTIKLGDLLTKEQITETIRIMQLPVDEIERTKLLKQYYGKFREELLAKGADSDYLAYAIPYWILKG